MAPILQIYINLSHELMREPVRCYSGSKENSNLFE